MLKVHPLAHKNAQGKQIILPPMPFNFPKKFSVCVCTIYLCLYFYVYIKHLYFLVVSIALR